MEYSNLFTRCVLSLRAGIHYHTVDSLVKRGIITPAAVIGGISYYDDTCVNKILEYYRLNPKRGRKAVCENE